MNAMTLPFFNTQSSAPDLQTDLKRARILANWLDTKFQIAGIRFGLEGIVGMIPVVGDTLGLVAGLYPIYVARRHNLSRALRVQMAANLAIEWVIGLTPVVGDVADIWFKANLKNLKLLEKAAADRSRTV